MQQPMINLEDISDPTTAMHMTLVLIAKAFKLNYSTPTNNNQGISSNPFQNSGIQNVGNQNGLIIVLGIANPNEDQNRNGNVVASRAEGDLKEIEEVNANCILMVNLQQASTSGTQTDKAPVYDSDGSAELSKEKSNVSCLQQEKKRLKSDFKTREDKLFDKQIQLENKIKELDNILVKMGQSIQTMHMLSPKPDSLYHIEQKMDLEADESLVKHKTLEYEIECLLKAVFSQDIMSIVQSNPVVDTSNLQTELERMKERFLNKRTPPQGTVRFGNDHNAANLGYGDLQWGNILITRVYFVKRLGHNLFSVGQFCDSDLEVAFRRNTCFVRNLEGVNLLKGNRTTNLYIINLLEMASASLIYLMACATSTISWLWRQRLSYLNFDTINNLAKNDLIIGLPKFKYHKEHLCPSCEQGKRKKSSHPPKPVPNSKQTFSIWICVVQ
ncbi:retrovirus-related pol polyprotein from transposon TNT 1-94 [Tanacetum coccineum]